MEPAPVLDSHPYLKLTGRTMPVQIEGTTPDGDQVYFRYRHGLATLDINDETLLSMRLGGAWDGDMDPMVALRLVASCLDLRAALAGVLAGAAAATMNTAMTNLFLALGPPPAQD